MSSLPTVENSADCGGCCREQESPPGYVLFPLTSEDAISFVISEHWQRVLLVPEKLQAELDAFPDDSFHSHSVPRNMDEYLNAYKKELQLATSFLSYLMTTLIENAGDYKQVLMLPDGARGELIEYRNIPRGAAHPRNGIYLWFYAQDRKCRYTKLHPSIWHEFEVGSHECLDWCEQYKDSLIDAFS